MGDILMLKLEFHSHQKSTVKTCYFGLKFFEPKSCLYISIEHNFRETTNIKSTLLAVQAIIHAYIIN